jgi:hypothetical protein
VGADLADQTAQVAGDLAAFRPLGRAQYRADKAPVAVKDHNRLEAIVIMMGVEHPQLLAAVDGVEGIVDVQHDALGHLPEGGAVRLNHGPTHADQGADVGQVLQARQRRLRAKIGPAGQACQGNLEDRIAAQGAGVVGILIASRNHRRAKRHHIGQRVLNAAGVARIVRAVGEATGQSGAPFDLAQHQKAAIRGNGAAVKPGDDVLVKNR